MSPVPIKVVEILDGPRRGRPRKSVVMEAIPLRISEELLEQIDAYHAKLQQDLPGLGISRADAVRQLIAIGPTTESDRLS